MSVVEKLDAAFYGKIEGNEFFKKGEVARAADAYYHAIIYCRELTCNPKYCPNIGHSEDQQKLAREIHESSFSNLALVQYKCALPMEKTDISKAKDSQGGDQFWGRSAEAESQKCQGLLQARPGSHVPR